MDELIEKAKKGDKNAFTQIILENKLKLYKIARAKIKNEEDIEDIIQETMIIMYTRLNKLKDNNKFNIWLYKILINKCNERYRKNKFKFISYKDIDNEIVDYSNKSMDNILEYEELLQTLKKDEKILVLLYYSNGYTTKQIAQILNKNENTIKTKLRRIREKLKNKCKEVI